MRLQQPQLPAAPNDKFLGDLVFKVKSILTGIVNAVNGKAASGANSDITSLTGLTTALTVAQGGTGAASPSAARGNLGAAASGSNSDITALAGLTTALSVAQGGTGQTTANAAADALGAYRRGTILGTVSQAAGVPTGAVIEQGSNANGRYVRFADGTQICTFTTNLQGAANNAIGSIYRSGSYIWTYPAAFSGATPVVFANESAVNGFAWGGLGAGAVNLTNATFAIFSAFAQTSASNASLSAIGRWF